MTTLYIVGGQQRGERSLVGGGGDWYEYQRGVILELDTASGEARQRAAYVSPPEVRGEHDPILFKSATLEGDILYACTQTEVLLYRVPAFEHIDYLSLPSFNDVHHVRPLPNGDLLIAISGLDMVSQVTQEGRIVREWSALGEDPWARFSRSIDYRRGVVTKPHRSHPNHVFLLADEIWTTRFQQKDAISLTRPGRAIPIGIERVHDGLVHDGRIYFTTVNGHVVIASASTLAVEEDMDLNAMHKGDEVLGWCRGVLVDGSRLWAGFSRLRPTPFRENVSWVVQGFRRTRATHVACYDLAARRCVVEIDLERFGLNAVFSILPGS